MFHAVPVAVGRLDEATTLFIRPERVRVGEAAKGCDNRFTATVRETIFHGDHLRIVADVCDTNFVVKVPNLLEGIAHRLPATPSTSAGRRRIAEPSTRIAVHPPTETYAVRHGEVDAK